MITKWEHFGLIQDTEATITEPLKILRRKNSRADAKSGQKRNECASGVGEGTEAD